MHDATVWTEVVASLDMVVMERLAEGRFGVMGKLPGWFRELYPEVVTDPKDVPVRTMSPFLENFLVDAEAFWCRREPGRLASGPWSESDTGALEACAIRAGGRQFLCIERLGPAYEETRSVLQKAREHHLDYQRLQQLEAALRTSHDDLLSILNELRIGTALINEAGRLTFLSDMCQHLLGTEAPEVLGKSWKAVVPTPLHAVLQEMSERPAAERTKLPVHMTTDAGQHYWMDIDIQDDPRDAQRRIICLYDMTEVHDLRRQLSEKAQFHDLVGKSEPMLRIYQQIRDVARVDTTVVIEGETGTGKELVARAIHAASHRASRPFVAVNCAGLTESLLASQLFGHRRGAFTGAVADQQGLFEAADGGTLFLDEIGDIPLNVQTSLLRVLQEREIIRLGEARPRSIDVRILAATHRNLQEEVEKGTFRADLLYRIRVARIHLPTLRERRQDIPLLTSTFLTKCRAEIDKAVDEVSHEAMRYLLDYAWPGNVRELRSAIEYAVIRCRGAVIPADDLPPEAA
ncbi:hypothetical protein C2W62_02810 [Candidatus Entotheonella serta]|nr:hypothetical protein C2W62_02810 [Candidatus Entotheonella serta]